MKIFNALLALGLTILIGSGIVVAWGIAQFKFDNDITQPKMLTITSGSSTKYIAQQLQDKDLIKSSLIFEIGARITKAKLKAGEFLIPPQSSPADIAKILSSDKVISYQVTLAEGLTTREIINILNTNTILTGKITNIPAEGVLLPETYSFTRGDTRQDIIDRMTRDFQIALQKLWDGREEGLPLKSMGKAVILASIVEKETGFKSERTEVAGVFTNRLRMGMPLQSDPTTIYALTLGKYDLGRALTYKDLKKASPYNTYHVQGLPPAPICNPGLKSLHATLHPAKHKFLYFVADGSGGHAFAKNLKGHTKNVAHWRKINRSK